MARQRRHPSVWTVLRKWLKKRWKVLLAFVVIAAATVAVSKRLFDFSLTANLVILLVEAAVGTLGVLSDIKSVFGEETAQAAQLQIAGEQVQVISGEGARGVQVNHGDYYEGGEHTHIHPPAPEKPTPQVTSIPSQGAPDYIPRGEIETTLRAALRRSTTNALVGASGMGGVGKTELAKQLARELEDEREGSTLWVDLPGKSLEQVHIEMATALGVQLPPNAAKEDRARLLRAALAAQQRTVFLDDARREFVPDLPYCLPPSPPCAALVTSRVSELGLLPGAVRDLDVMTPEQARALLRSFDGLPALLDAEPGAEARLVEACCCHPLAQTLAAARLLEKRHFWPQPAAGLAAALQHRLDELQRGGLAGKDASLRANIDASYAELNAEEQRCFRALAVFAPSGFGAAGAAAVWQLDEAAAQEMILRLARLSLLRRVEQHPGRWRLHDLLRDYAAEALARCGEQAPAEARLAEYLITLFDEHFTDTRAEAPQVALEQDNLFRAAGAARAARDGPRLAQLATRPYNWLMGWSQWSDWEGWLRAALDLGAGDGRLTGDVHQYLGDVQRMQNDYAAALASYARALELLRAVGDRQGEANTLRSTGEVQRRQNDYAAALASYARALELYRAVGGRLGEANTLAGQGRVLLAQGDQPEADRLLARAVELYTAIGDRYSIAAQTGNYGATLYNLGRKAAARPYLLRAAELFERINMPEQAERDRRAAAEED